jgi:hypothetical protein
MARRSWAGSSAISIRTMIRGGDPRGVVVIW